jgi:hypothetical protein
VSEVFLFADPFFWGNWLSEIEKQRGRERAICEHQFSQHGPRNINRRAGGHCFFIFLHGMLDARLDIHSPDT